MDRIGELKRNFSRRFKKSTSKDDMEDKDSSLKINEEKRCINWKIENINVCPLKSGEYLESPSFYTGFLNGTKWALRLYPRGRNGSNSDKVGLFIFRISSRETCTVNYQLTLTDSNSMDIYFNNNSIFEDFEEYGTDEFLYSEALLREKFLTIKCNMLVRYLGEAEAYQIADRGSPTCSCALPGDLEEMYLSGKHADAVLQVGEVKIPVHKVILGARSKFFAAIFKHDQNKSNCAEAIPIEGIELSILKNLLQYIYTGKINDITIDKAIILFPVAEKYFLTELQTLCLNVILMKMSVENFCSIATLADNHCPPKLMLAMNNFFCNYSSQIFEREEWKTFVHEKRRLASEMLATLASDHKTKYSIICTDDF